MAKQQRDVVKEAYWRDVLKRFAESGLSVREFCKREQLTESQFYAWRRTLSERDGNCGNVDLEPSFVSAIVENQQSDDQPIVLTLASGSTLHLPLTMPVAQIAELVRQLEPRGA
jgi:transposase-like protein